MLWLPTVASGPAEQPAKTAAAPPLTPWWTPADPTSPSSVSQHNGVNPSPPWTKWPPFWQTTFFIASSWMKMFEFRFKFYRNRFQGVQLTISQHWFRYWLVPNRRQAITWINDDPVHWRIYAALRGWVKKRPIPVDTRRNDYVIKCQNHIAMSFWPLVTSCVHWDVFADILKHFSLNEKCCVLIQLWLMLSVKLSIALVRIMDLNQY